MNEKNKHHEDDGISILSLDSGGPSVYSQLLILKEYMARLAGDFDTKEETLYPADFFDLMGGVGFGALIAIMLGHLRMTADEAMEALHTLASTVFPESLQNVMGPEQRTSVLKEAIEHILVQKGELPDTKMYEENRPPVRCKVILYAVTAVDITHPRAFRTYPSRGLSLNPSIVNAICATIAVPSHFSPAKIGPENRQQTFVGGPRGANNPTRLLLNEASNIFGNDKRVAQIVSIGSGLANVLSLDGLAEGAGVARLLNEMAADCQLVAQELATRLFHVEAYLRLNVSRGIDSFNMEDWRVLGEVESHTSVYLDDPAVTEAIETSVRHLQDRMGAATLGQMTLSSSIKIPAKKPPAVSPYFVLREKSWETMVDHLVTSESTKQIIFPITGMGGCGKTQLVSYFLQQYPNLYTRTVYVDASSSSSIKTDLQTWSRAIGGDHESDVWEDALSMLNSAPQDEQWVLILDNADDPALNLVQFLPKNINVTILITSRNRDIGSLSTTHHLELGEMSPSEAFALMLLAARRDPKLSQEEMHSAQTLIKELGCLAVALVQAGTYCYQLSLTNSDTTVPYTFTQYLTLFNLHRAELMKDPGPTSLDNYQRSVYTTLDLSYKALPQDARDFLHLISFFHYTDIPLIAVATASKKAFRDPVVYLPRPKDHQDIVSRLKNIFSGDKAWSELTTQKIIRTLRSFSLLTASSVDDCIFLHLHPLIQAWCRDMDSTSSSPYRAMAIQVLTACEGDPDFKLNQYIPPHVLEVMNQIWLSDLHINSLMAFGILIGQRGHYHKALKTFEISVERMKRSEKANSKEALTVASQLGRMYRKEGKWRESEELLKELLQAHRRILGFDHPRTITAAVSLASTYQAQGRWAEAEKLDVEVLDQRRRLLGREHPDTIAAAGNLATTYNAQERWSEAEKLQVEVLEQTKRILGMEHPHTLKAASNLGVTYGEQGRWEEAEQLEVEVLEQRTRILGKEHPHTIKATVHLAGTYQRQGRLEEAIAILAPTVHLSIKVFGQHHPLTQKRIRSLVSIYGTAGKQDEAKKMRDLLLLSAEGYSEPSEPIIDTRPSIRQSLTRTLQKALHL